MRRLRDLEKSKDVRNIPLIPSTPEQMEDMLKLCSFVRFKIPHQVQPSQLILGIQFKSFFYFCMGSFGKHPSTYSFMQETKTDHRPHDTYAMSTVIVLVFNCITCINAYTWHP